MSIDKEGFNHTRSQLDYNSLQVGNWLYFLIFHLYYQYFSQNMCEKIKRNPIIIGVEFWRELVNFSFVKRNLKISIWYSKCARGKLRTNCSQRDSFKWFSRKIPWELGLNNGSCCPNAHLQQHVPSLMRDVRHTQVGVTVLTISSPHFVPLFP